MRGVIVLLLHCHRKMANRIPLVVSYKNLVKHLHSTSAKNANARVHTQGGDSIVGASAQGAVKATEVLENVGERAKETVDTALDAAKKTTEGVTETTTMVEADNNVVDTVEYRCTEDLRGQLGDGHDSYN
uniref:Chilling-induced protein n=2 Tax=Glycine subgen. Soja TaxID=1462606 RepID=B3GJZ6_SOYBN|nr:chilling-induced protein [Glycine max]